LRVAPKIGLNFGNEIDFRLFTFTSEQIDDFELAAKEIETFFILPISQKNFSGVANVWYRLVSTIPLPVILTDVNFILRSRPSKEFEVFTDEADISYNTKCPELIKPGRFNRPTEAVFYGTLPSDKQEKFVPAVSIESYKDLINEGNTNEVLYYHICKFLVKTPFPVINLCFEPRVLQLHPGLNRVVMATIQNLKNNLPHESFEAIIKFWSYMSSLASERKLCDQHYMVNTALFCAIRHYYEKSSMDLVNGIIYPSPMVYGDAVNIVMMPHAVDQYLKADDCFIFKYIRGLDNKKSFETNICSKPSKVLAGKLNISDVVWGRKLANYT
jgi:hypothetical protein